jgi:O-antigen biosynthesis protein WbqV
VAATGHSLGDSETAEQAVYVLNMGQPVKIKELAEHMIRLHGLEPGVDIDVIYTGVRPGERIEEILFARNERHVAIGVPGIVAAGSNFPPLETQRQFIAALREAVQRDDRSAVYGILADAVPDFRGKAA